MRLLAAGARANSSFSSGRRDDFVQGDLATGRPMTRCRGQGGRWRNRGRRVSQEEPLVRIYVVAFAACTPSLVCCYHNGRVQTGVRSGDGVNIRESRISFTESIVDDQKRADVTISLSLFPLPSPCR